MGQIQFILSKRIHFCVLAFVLLQLLLVGCNNSKETSPEAKLAFENLIPKPVSSNTTGKAYFITDETAIHVAEEQFVKAGEFLAAKLRPATGFELPVSISSEKAGRGILLNLSGEASLGEEGYTISILEDGLTLSAYKPAGIIRGIQTIRQLLPANIESNTVQQNQSWEIATGTITDYPQYAWRGAMLDVARHFFSVEDVKRYIDLISYYKINILHLHLSDDQGWRIEIKSWPNLTKIGGSTEVGGGEGGFYTQEQYADIVAYAQDHYITIVPEIDMPGHTNAALASYSELNDGPSIRLEAGSPVNPAESNNPALSMKPVAGKLYTGVEVGFSTLHFKKEITLKFVEDVVREIASMTPGPYMHIGGDEAAVTKKDDYIQFINKFKTIVESHGKKMIGWEEIAQGDIDANVLVQYWHADKYATMAVEKGAKLILSPSKKVYLDMQYDSTSRIGLHWAAYIEVDSSYQWDPATHINGVSAEHIAGVEAPLWTETVETMDDIEYLVFPRLPGVAEVGWSASSVRDWNTYKVRLGHQSKRWKNMGIDYYESPVVPWQD